MSGLFLAGEHAYSARTGHENVSLLSYFWSFLNIRLTIVYYEQKKRILLFDHVPWVFKVPTGSIVPCKRV